MVQTAYSLGFQIFSYTGLVVSFILMTAGCKELGDFTASGHFIVLTEVKDGKIKVNDPNSKVRSSKLWAYETLEGQIKNLWVFRK